MSRRLLVLFVAVIAMVHLDAQNLWQDSGFENSGVAVSFAHGSGKVGRHIVGVKTYWLEYQHSSLPVEPFAVYRASAYVRRDASGTGGAYALHSFGWDCFGWGFGAFASIPVTDQWAQVITTFCVPADFVDFSPLVFNNAENSTIYIDDLEIFKVMSGKEHIRQVMQMEDEIPETECELLARYYLKNNDLDSMRQLIGKTASDHAKADVCCLMAQQKKDVASREALVADMIRFGALDLSTGSSRFKPVQ